MWTFRKKNKKSEYRYTIKNKINIQDKELFQYQYATEHYVVTELNGKIMFFSKEENDNFMVDEEHKVLKPIDLSAQKDQIKQFKTLIGDVQIIKNENSETILGLPTSLISLDNNSEQIKLQGNINIISLKGLEDTSFALMRAKEDCTKLFNLPLEQNELIARLSVIINAGDTAQTQNTELLSFESEIENFQKYDDYLNYKIKR